MMVNPNDALEMILKDINPVGTEVVDIFNGLNRIVRKKITCNRNLPPFDNSAMDGYAVKYEDIKQIPTNLKEIGIIAAGDNKQFVLSSGECCRIMTGAFIPEGADTVVEFEATEKQNDLVKILKEKKAGANIRKKGEDISIGEVIDFTGEKLDVYRQSRLVSTGNLFVSVSRKLRIAVMSTGDELDYPDSGNPAATIDNNSFFIKYFLEPEGAQVDYFGISSDENSALLEKFKMAKDYDLIITSAGISNGDFDVVSNSAKEAGIKWMFTTVNQKPGKPFSFGFMNNEIPVVSLPGNPVSSSFCTFFYVLPLVRKMLGYKNFENIHYNAATTHDMKKSNNRYHFNRGFLKYSDGKFVVEPYFTQDSHIIKSIAESNCFIMVPGEIKGIIPAGTVLKVFKYR
jgi:molybdopterin molybdotransferase